MQQREIQNVLILLLEECIHLNNTGDTGEKVDLFKTAFLNINRLKKKRCQVELLKKGSDTSL